MYYLGQDQGQTTGQKPPASMGFTLGGAIVPVAVAVLAFMFIAGASARMPERR